MQISTLRTIRVDDRFTLPLKGLLVDDELVLVYGFLATLQFGSCHKHHCDLRNYSFAVRVVNMWNSFPESVIVAETTNCFKNRLDKFWNNQ